MNTGRTGLLLAGGRSVRMGRDKAFLLLRGKPLWLRQAELLRDAGVGRWVVSCRREQGLAAQAMAWSAKNELECEVAFDPEGEGGGMVEAIVNGLRLAGRPTMVLSVDMPLVTVEMIQLLWETVGESDCGCLLKGSRGPEPFPGLYVPSMRDELGGGKAMRAGLDRCVDAGLARVIEVTQEMEVCLANWNHPSDVVDTIS